MIKQENVGNDGLIKLSQYFSLKRKNPIFAKMKNLKLKFPLSLFTIFFFCFVYFRAIMSIIMAAARRNR